VWLNRLEVNHHIFLDIIIALKGLDVSLEILQLVKEGRVLTHVVVGIVLVSLSFNAVKHVKVFMSQNTMNIDHESLIASATQTIAVTRDQWWISFTS
jgi:uncharacterized membrane protein